MWRFIRKPQPANLNEIRVLCLLSDHPDRATIAAVCQSREWKLIFADEPGEAREVSVDLKPHVILFDRDLAESGWREVMTSLAQSCPGTCILLASKVMDGYLWNEVVRNGGYDVLRKPLDAPEVSRAVRLAWSYWNRANQTPFAAK